MNARVVVVDDDADSREYAMTVLHGGGYEPLAFGDPREAIAWFEAANPCDVLVCDVVLPHVTGLELARLVHASRPALAIVMCTGHVAGLEEAIARGMLPLVKPYSPQQLLALVEDAVGNAGRGVG